MNEYGLAWSESRRRLSELVRSTDLETLNNVSPLTPEWRIRDVIAHVVGAGQDFGAGNFPQDFDAWTSAQVARLADTSAHELVDMWEAMPIAEALSEPLAIFVYDQVTHEADVFHALQRPNAIDDACMNVLMNFTLRRFGAKRNNLTVTLNLDGQTWTTGDGDVALSLEASRFEWFRASNGRRSAAQIRAMKWQGDVDVVELLFGDKFFTPAAHDVVDV